MWTEMNGVSSPQLPMMTNDIRIRISYETLSQSTYNLYSVYNEI